MDPELFDHVQEMRRDRLDVVKRMTEIIDRVVKDTERRRHLHMR